MTAHVRDALDHAWPDSTIAYSAAAGLQISQAMRFQPPALETNARVDCPDCGGAAAVATHHHDPQHTTTAPCWVCDRTGQVPA